MQNLAPTLARNNPGYISEKKVAELMGIVDRAYPKLKGEKLTQDQPLSLAKKKRSIRRRPQLIKVRCARLDFHLDYSKADSETLYMFNQYMLARKLKNSVPKVLRD